MVTWKDHLMMRQPIGTWKTIAAAVVVFGSMVASGSPVRAATSVADPGSVDSYTFAVIGDTPYGDAAAVAFPGNIAQINADPTVQWVDHLGDIKSGSTVCSDDYYSRIRKNFDTFEDPLVYTIGDNEWTDCHRPNNGAYNPLERLAAIRKIFFPQPWFTLGRDPARVETQAEQGFPENVRWRRAGVAFAALHIVGSNNSLAPWTGNTTATPEQTAEVLARTAATIEEIRDSFADARRHHDRAVVLLTQADMFDATVTNPAYADYYAFTPIVSAIAREAARFGKPVYLFNGDSHVYNSDHPLAAGSAWLNFYGVTTPADKLTRITVDGSNNATNYLRVTVKPSSTQVLGWERIPFTS